MTKKTSFFLRLTQTHRHRQPAAAFLPASSSFLYSLLTRISPFNITHAHARTERERERERERETDTYITAALLWVASLSFSPSHPYPFSSSCAPLPCKPWVSTSRGISARHSGTSCQARRPPSAVFGSHTLRQPSSCCLRGHG
jgi:hypothetical protein